MTINTNTNTNTNTNMNMNTKSASQLSAEIDALLEHYLGRLHNYSLLRAQLNKHQSSVHHNISRANFSAERGVRYGAESYDARLQAVRTCRVTAPASDGPSQRFNIVYAVSNSKLASVESSARSGAATVPCTLEPPSATIPELGSSDEDNKIPDCAPALDPMRMFGLLTPSTLRAAQKEGIQMVEDTIPNILAVDAQLKELEIAIRRARKFLGKATEREEKETLERMGNATLEDSAEEEIVIA